MVTVTRTRQVDLVLVNPGGRSQIYQSLGGALTAIEPPVWAGLMATFIRQRGFSVVLVDADAEGLTPEEAAERIAKSPSRAGIYFPNLLSRAGRLQAILFCRPISD